METMNKTNRLCEKCGSKNLKTRKLSYPVKIRSQHLHIQRVSLRECLYCHALIPTKVGKEKIDRCVMTFMNILDKKTTHQD